MSLKNGAPAHNWIAIILTVVTLVVSAAMFMASIQNVSTKALENTEANKLQIVVLSGVSESLNEKIHLLELKQAADDVRLINLQDSIYDLTSSVKETNEMNRQLLLHIAELKKIKTMENKE